MNPLLAIGQILVSIALIAAVLLQARGTGLSGTFGGESAVYRSRRGVERRLWQFTIVLLVLFVVFSIASFVFAPTTCPARSLGGATHHPGARLTRTDSFVVGTLVVAFAIIAGLVGVPALLPASQVAAPSSSPDAYVSRPYREGVVGHPFSVSPLTARTQADRDLVALVFSGLVKNGPSGTLLPDLAETWTVDDTGATWTFELRAGRSLARRPAGHGAGCGVHDPDAPGPGLHRPGGWLVEGRHGAGVGPSTVVFSLKNPLGGFLQAATQPIAPAHLLGDVPWRRWRTIRSASTRLGPARLRWSGSTRTAPSWCRPLPSCRTKAEPRVPSPPVVRLARHGGADDSSRRELSPYLAGIDSGTSIPLTNSLPRTVWAASMRRRACRRTWPASWRRRTAPVGPVPRLDPDGGPVQPSSEPPRVHDARDPHGLPRLIDRPALIDAAFGMIAGAANGPIPPASPCSIRRRDVGRLRHPGRQKALKDAGWTKLDNAWRRATDDAPLTFEMLSPTPARTRVSIAAAVAVAPTGNTSGSRSPTWPCRRASS